MNREAPHACLWLAPDVPSTHDQQFAQKFWTRHATLPRCCVATGAGSPDAHAVGAKGTVTLDARFDCGYFVTVHIGCQEFKGMLYYPSTLPAEVSFRLVCRDSAISDEV